MMSAGGREMAKKSFMLGRSAFSKRGSPGKNVLVSRLSMVYFFTARCIFLMQDCILRHHDGAHTGGLWLYG